MTDPASTGILPAVYRVVPGARETIEGGSGETNAVIGSNVSSCAPEPRAKLMSRRIIFLREFSPAFSLASGTANGPNGSATGTSTPRSKSRDPRDSRREAFVPENVYDAMKENKRFDSMRVSLSLEPRQQGRH